MIYGLTGVCIGLLCVVGFMFVGIAEERKTSRMRLRWLKAADATIEKKDAQLGALHAKNIDMQYDHIEKLKEIMAQVNQLAESNRSLRAVAARIVDEREKSVTEEKAGRLYYQGIVYAVCDILDCALGTQIVCGTAHSQSREVQDSVQKLCTNEKGKAL